MKKNDLFNLALFFLKKRMKAQGISRENRQLYREQLLYEAKLILKWKLESHFLAAMDMAQHLKEKGFIVGPSGGNASASLLAYALGIHDVDPIRHGLIFGSFLDDLTWPVFQFFLCQDGQIEARNFLCERYGKKHIAWEGYGEHEPLVITQRPIKEVLAITGMRPDFPVVRLSNKPGEIHGIRMQLITTPLLGRISGTLRFLNDIDERDLVDFNFETFFKAPDVVNNGEGDGLPDWVPDKSLPVVDCLKKLGPPRDWDDFVFAYHLATTIDEIEREKLIGEWLTARRKAPWESGELNKDEAVQEILACTHGVVVYAEQIIQLLAYYQSSSMPETIQLFRSMKKWRGSSQERDSAQAEFVSAASFNGHEGEFASMVFDFLAERAAAINYAFKNKTVGQALLANGAAQTYWFFGMAGA